MKRRAKSKSARGAALVEYALTIALIAIASMAAVNIVGKKVSVKISEAADRVGACSFGDSDCQGPVGL